jgi:hypothetical protein
MEGVNSHVNCGAACSLGLRLNCSGTGRNECPTILRTPAKSAVVFEDLTEGEYIVTVNCEDDQESEASCYAGKELMHTSEIEVEINGISLRIDSSSNFVRRVNVFLTIHLMLARLVFGFSF